MGLGGATVTLKVRIRFDHVGKLSKRLNRGLAIVGEQASEASHYYFEKGCVKN